MKLRLCFLLIMLFILSVTPIGAQQMEDNNYVIEYEDALSLYALEQFGNAQIEFDALCRKDIRKELAISSEYYAALCAMNLFNSDAESRLQSFERKYPSESLNNNLKFSYAVFKFSLRRYKESVFYFEKLDSYLLNAEDRAEYNFKYAYSLLMQKDEKRAKEYFFKLKDKETIYSSSARYYYAHLLYVDSNFSEALTNFLPLQDDESFGPLVPYYLAHIYYKLKDFDKLVELGEDLFKNANTKRAAEIAKLLGDAFYEKKDYKNAAKYLQLYVDESSRIRTEERYQLAFSYYSIGSYKAALDQFNTIGAGPENIRQNALYHSADCYLKTGNRREAMTSFKLASELKAIPIISEDSYFNYCKLIYELNSPYEAAISVLNEYLLRYPNSGRSEIINSYLANLYLTTKDFPRAMRSIKEVGIEKPAMRAAYQKISFYQAVDVYNSFRYAEALVLFKEVLKYPVDLKIDALSKYWIGESYYRLLNFQQALDYYKKFRMSSQSISLKEFELSQYNMAYCYFRLQNYSSAADNFRSFISDSKIEDPRTLDSYLKLGDCYLMLGSYLLATKYYDLAEFKKAVDSDYAAYQSAECMGLADKPIKKIERLNKLIKTYPKSELRENAFFQIGETYLQMEDYKKAESAYVDFRSMYPSSILASTSLLRIGLIQSNQDLNDKAINTYQTVVETYPNTDESIEAVGLARIVFARSNQMSDYLDWVDGLDFVNFEKSSLDSTTYNSAFDLYSSAKYADALIAFQTYLQRFENGIFWTRSNYYLAKTALRQGEKEIALMAYENLAKLPANQYSFEALWTLAEEDYQARKYPEAREKYKEMLKIALDEEAKKAARIGIMFCSFELGDYQESARVSSNLMAESKLDNDILIQSLRISAISNYKIGDKLKALQSFETNIVRSSGEFKAEALYYKSLILNEREQFDSSTAVVNKLIKEMPSFKEYKIKSLVILAKNFMANEDFFQAKYTLDFVIKSDYSEELTNEAKELKMIIQRIEDESQLKKEQEIKEKNKPILLNDDIDLMIIDQAEEEEERMEIE